MFKPDRHVTNQRDLRRAFWSDVAEYPDGYRGVSRRKITNYSGNSKMHNTDTRCAFTDWLDHMVKSDQISQKLAQRATLD